MTRRTHAADAIRKPPPVGVERLPKESRAKLLRILADGTDARDRHTDQSKKLNDLIAKSVYQGDQPDEALAVMVERARAAQSAAREADIMYRDLCNRLTRYVDGLFMRVEKYEPEIKRRVRVGKRGDLKHQIAEVREQIESIIFEIRKAKSAPIALEEAKEKAARYLTGLAAESTPQLVVAKDGKGVELYLGTGRERLSPELAGVRRVLGGAIALVGVDKALAIMMPPQREAAGALTTAQRKARIADLQDKLLDAEREEESLIELAAGEGMIVLRRSNADPRAVLGIVVPERVL